MILPNKDIELSSSYIGISALILSALKNYKIPVEILWKKSVKVFKKYKLKEMPTLQKIVYVLDFMYIVGMINYDNEGRIYNENY